MAGRRKDDYGFGCMGVKFKESIPLIIEVNTRLCGMLANSKPVLSSFITSLANTSQM